MACLRGKRILVQLDEALRLLVLQRDQSASIDLFHQMSGLPGRGIFMS
jgi:hypothetical protein